MTDTCETVIVETPNGPVRVNASDVPTTNQRLAMKEGSKWFVVDAMGNKLDDTSYASKAAVDEAIRAL